MSLRFEPDLAGHNYMGKSPGRKSNPIMHNLRILIFPIPCWERISLDKLSAALILFLPIYGICSCECLTLLGADLMCSALVRIKGSSFALSRGKAAQYQCDVLLKREEVPLAHLLYISF